MRKSLRTTIIILITLILSGCVYFNTFYNAKKNYKTANERALNAHGRPSAQAIKEYNAVIKQCGKIITNYKGSKWMDDAAFLMAKALFYKQTNPHKALKQFNEVIDNFPNSEFTPEARLYVMRLYRKMHKEEDLNKYSTDFLIAPENKKFYNKAHLLIAEFNLEDKEYTKAMYHLGKILDGDKKSNEYSEAFLLLGKVHHLAGEYQEAIDTLTSLLKTRASVDIKLDSNYYLAYSYYHLNELKKAEKIVDKLINKESRVERVPYVKMLRGRIKLAEGDTDGFIDDMKFILDNHSRTLVAAECSFYLGEYYLYNAFDYTEAITYYNRVKTESRDSEFVESAITKSSVASQIQLLSDPDRQLNPKTLVDEQFKLAEYFINIMNMPDSALVVYDNIIETEKTIELKLDTLRLELEKSRQEFIDYQDSLRTAQIDTLVINDSTYTDTTITDTSLVETTVADSVEVEESKFENSSVYNTVYSQILNLESTLDEFHRQILPFTYFVKSWIYFQVKSDTVEAHNIYNELSTLYKDNEYTYACSLMLSGEIPDLQSPKQKEDLLKYDTAVNLMYSNPDSSLSILSEFTNHPESHFYFKALYTSGYINKFVLNDTLSAKTFFDKLLEEDYEDLYRVNIRTFYQDGEFVRKEVEAVADTTIIETQTSTDSLITVDGELQDSVSTVIDEDPIEVNTDDFEEIEDKGLVRDKESEIKE